MSTALSPSDKRQLLTLARQALEAAVQGQRAPAVEATTLSPALSQPGASFVTLTIENELRGCIGGLHAAKPLWEDVREHAAQAALNDFRFPPVSPAETARIEVEVSVLSEPEALEYTSAQDLVRRLRPNIDGVILSQGFRRATFLPQVWEHVPQPERFLSMLCEKMGVAPETWRHGKLTVQTYQVEKFTEKDIESMRD